MFTHPSFQKQQAVRFFGLLFLLTFACTLSLLLHSTALAQVDEDEITEPCESCHSQEADAWLQSMHATDGATDQGAACTNCHGDYVRGHPDDEAMPLKVDSSMCVDCHKTTHEQWQDSIHASADVQCISCHAPHSQQMRLTDERLCKSCHQSSLDDSLHSAHWDSDATCTSCHMTIGPETEALASSDPTLAALLTPDHDFVSVSSRNCLTCHRGDVSAAGGRISYDQELRNAKQTSEQQVHDLAAELQSIETANRSLFALSLANLGFGVGIGGMLGVVLMLVLARIGTRR